MKTKDENGTVDLQQPLLDVETSIKMYKHLLIPNLNFGTDIFAHDYKSEGIVLIEDVSLQSKGIPIRFDCYALILRLKGESNRSVNQHSYHIGPRSLQLINPGSLFSFEDISKSANSFVLLFDKSFMTQDNLSTEALNRLIVFHQRYIENIQ